MDCYHVNLLCWANKSRHPGMCISLYWFIASFLKLPREFERLQVIACEIVHGTTNLCVMEWYSGRSLQVNLPGFCCSVAFLSTVEDGRRILESQRLAVATRRIGRGDASTVSMINCRSGLMQTCEWSGNDYFCDELALNPYGHDLAMGWHSSGYDDALLTLWNSSASSMRTYSVQEMGEISRVAYSPSGALLAIGHESLLEDRRVGILDWRTGYYCFSQPLHHAEIVEAFSFSAREDRLACAAIYSEPEQRECSHSGCLIVFDVASMDAVHTMLLPQCTVNDASHHPSDGTVAVACATGVAILDVASGTQSWMLRSTSVSAVEFTHSGSHLVVGCSGAVVLIDFASKAIVYRLPLPLSPGFRIHALAFLRCVHEGEEVQHDDFDVLNRPGPY